MKDKRTEKRISQVLMGQLAHVFENGGCSRIKVDLDDAKRRVWVIMFAEPDEGEWIHHQVPRPTPKKKRKAKP